MGTKVSLKSAKPISNGALKDSALPQRIKVLNWGANTISDGSTAILDDESAKVFYANQKAASRTQVPIDFNHNTVPGTVAFNAEKEPRSVAAHGIPTLIPGDGLYLEYVNWTDDGNKSARNYPDLSPTPALDENGRVIALHSVALTQAGKVENLHFYSADSLAALVAGGAKVEPQSSDATPAPAASVKPFKAKFADKRNRRMSIDTQDHVRAAWDQIHTEAHKRVYSEEESAKIFKRVHKRAGKLGVQLKAFAGDEAMFNRQPHAYANDPYSATDSHKTSMDAEFTNMLEEFRKHLGMGDDAKPDDIMKAIRAKWLGIADVKNPLPKKTPDSNLDPSLAGRGGPSGLTQGDKGTPAAGGVTPHGTITYSAEDLAKAIEDALKAKLAPMEAEFTTIKAAKAEEIKKLEQQQRESIKAEISSRGCVIPLSDDDWNALPLKTCESMASKLQPSVNLGQNRALRPMSADKDGKLVAMADPSAKQRGIDSLNAHFKQHGLQRVEGPVNWTPGAVN